MTRTFLARTAKLFLWASLALWSAVSLQAQGNGFNSALLTIFSTATSSSAIKQNSLMLYHQIKWTPVSAAACQVQIDSSPDGISWTAGGILAAQTCTSVGNSAIISAQANFVRVTVTSLTGTSVSVQYEGWAFNPSGTGVAATAGTYYATSNGLKCDGVTDDTAALSTLNTTVYNAGGGIIQFPPGACLISGHILMPNDNTANGAGYAFQRPVHWQGVMCDQSGEGANPTFNTRLLMQYSGAGTAKIETYGLGKFEIDHICFYDSTVNSLPFILSTGTTMNIHDNSFVGNCSGVTCTQDVILLGGYNSVFTGGVNDVTAAFQGYNTYIQHNYFQRIRRALYQKTYAGSVSFQNNFIGPACGSNLTAATLTLSAAANASAGTTVYTGTITGGAANGLATQSVTIAGFATAANNTNTGGSFPSAYQIIASTATTITVTNKIGVAETHAGTAVMTGGAAIEYDSTAQTGGGDNTNMIAHNRFEMTSYVYAGKFLGSDANTIEGNDFEDGGALGLAAWYFDANAVYNFARDAVVCVGIGSSAVYSVDVAGVNTVMNSGTVGCGPSVYNDNFNMNQQVTGLSPSDPATFHLKSTNNNDESYWQLFHGGSPQVNLFMKPAGGTAESLVNVVRAGLNSVTMSLNGTGTNNIYTCSQATSGYCFFQAISGGTARLGTAAAPDQIDITAALISLGGVPLKWQSDGGGTLGASNGGRPSSIFALNQVSSGVAAGSAGYIDLTAGYTTAAMTAQSSATCTNVTGMTWTIAASKRYRMKCMIPITFVASATVAFCLGGPGTPTSHTINAIGSLGVAAAYADISLVNSTTYGTKTTASGAVGASTQVITVEATIQNGATASGTALTLQTAANGTNNITVLADAECSLTQLN